FSAGADPGGSARHKGSLILDQTGSLSNPFHNNTKIRYEATSSLPVVPPQQLRRASPDFPDLIAANYLQLPQLDPRIQQLAEQITAGSTTEYDKAAKIELYLKTHYRYT